MSLLDTASLICTPNGYKEGKLYSVIPSDGSGDMSVTRATTATRVNSAGLVELVPYNLLRWSEDLTQWTANAQIATTQLVFNPLTGKNNATKITKVTSAGDPWVVQTNAAGDGTYTYSFYLWTDAGQPTDVTLFLYNSAVSEVYTLAITLTTTPTRYEYTSTFASTGGAINARVDLSATATNQYIYAYAGQLVEGSVAKDYQKTETRLNIPRLDYSNGTCPSLLVEPQRTNLLTYSSSFDNADWAKLNATISANTIASPSGIQDADLLTENTANTGHVIYRSGTGTSNTFSFYAKPNGRNWLAVLSNNGDYTFFNIANGTLGTIAATSTATIEDAENGWYRCTIYNTHPTFGASIYLSTGNGVAVYTGDGTSGAYIWGAQLEAGSYATSYIPTTSASVTRNADVISKTGISSLIGQTEGTIFWDVDFEVVANNDAIFIKENASYDTFVFMQKESSGVIACGYYGSGALQARIESSPVTVGRYKIAFAYKNNDFVMYLNGTQVGTDTSGTVSGLMDYFDLHWTESGCNNAYASALWKTRLTNTQLAALTTI